MKEKESGERFSLLSLSHSHLLSHSPSLSFFISLNPNFQVR
jgi:hypothetical protein